jgi:cytochrome c-type biogenesis protein CcmH
VRPLAGVLALGALAAALFAAGWLAQPREPQASAAARLAGRIELAPALQARAQPSDTVFIIARIADGPRMPVALLRRKAAELPLSFVLDDKAVTTPTLNLSPSTPLTVTVRISRSGSETAEPGDLQGSAGPVLVGTQDLHIEVNQTVP